MSPINIGIVFIFIWLLFGIPTLLILLRSYNRTQMPGFLWLIGAFVGWPLLTRVFTIFIPVISAALSLTPAGGFFGVPGLSFYVFVNLVEGMVGGLLIRLAFYMLDRDLAARISAPVPPPPL